MVMGFGLVGCLNQSSARLLDLRSFLTRVSASTSPVTVTLFCGTSTSVAYTPT